MAVVFYKCAVCGNVIEKMVDSGVRVVCCGRPMEELVPGVVDASLEKHVPHVTMLDSSSMRIEVGRVHHPMTPEHHISFIYVETDKGGVKVDVSGEPVADVFVGKAKPLAVFEYCNLHGLWKKEL